jgi:hypothetical protein
MRITLKGYFGFSIGLPFSKILKIEIEIQFNDNLIKNIF